MTRDEVKKHISDLMTSEPMPLVDICIDEAICDFDRLINLKLSGVLKETKWCSRYEYDSNYWFSDNVLTSSSVGNKSSNFFHQESRWHCDSINAPSPYRTWTTEKFRLTLLNALWSLKFEKVTEKELRQCIALRKYIASQFRPSAAKALYDLFEAEKILDTSSGWGDRLSGFMASENGKEYVGIDPNSRLVDGYNKQIDRFLSPCKHVTMINGRSESVKLESEYFDFAFTSPPYFNVERYTQDENQSFKMYKKLDDWLDNFLFKTMSNSWDALKSGGVLAINISDVYSGHKINKICDPMNDFISTLSGAKYIGAIGYEMRKRPNSNAVKQDGVFAEPIWMWRKL